ncbi:MAG TPA: hypothetical protein VMQ56_05895 [Terracidiphilus sp.]|nr:hypothetical protein [Terracidiphilus sp.]
MIHYAAPNSKIYPFCAYNSGPVYRERVEREFPVPLKRLEKVQRVEAMSGKKGCGSRVEEPELGG